MWQEKNGSLVREFKFSDFKSALAFVVKVGELAEVAEHHPDIELGWGRAVIILTTHDENGITEKDRQLAEDIDKMNII